MQNSHLKTRKEHLKALPLQKRLQAMENIRRQNVFSYGLKKTLNMNIGIQSVLCGCINFRNSKQGHFYWWYINLKWFENGK